MIANDMMCRKHDVLACSNRAVWIYSPSGEVDQGRRAGKCGVDSKKPRPNHRPHVPDYHLSTVRGISTSILKKASDPQQISDTISAGSTGEQQASRRIKVRQPENQHTWMIIRV